VYQKYCLGGEIFTETQKVLGSCLPDQENITSLLKAISQEWSSNHSPVRSFDLECMCIVSSYSICVCGKERGQGGPSGLVPIWHGVDPTARNIPQV
jgi:hypothetical protein